MMFSRKSLLSILFAVFVTAGALAVAPHAFAQVVDPTSGLTSFAESAGFATSETLTITIARLIRTVMGLLGIVAVVLILVGGFKYMTSGGNDEKIKSAKKLFSAAIVGLVIIMSAFAIVQFILGQLVGALGGTSSSSGSNSGSGSYGDGGGTSSQFVLTSVNTDCAYALKNLQLQFLFSQRPTLESINNGGIRVQKSGIDVEGTFAVSGKTATFTPTQDCGAEYTASEHCFDAETDYTIELSETLLESSNDLAYKCDVTYPCAFDFTTGTDVDTEGPTMTMDDPGTDGEAVFTNQTRSLSAHAIDDTGVSSAYFTIDDGDSIYDAGLSTDSTVGSLDPDNYFYTADGTEWYVSSDYATGSHDIRAGGYDCAGHRDVSAEISVEVYPASCNNEALDVEPDVSADLAEEEVDCGGNTCGACDGSSCDSNDDCASGYCSGEIDATTGLVIDGVCASVPQITSVSPGDGAEGNIVSIIGSGFGTTPGTVQFLGAVDTNGTYSNPVTASEYQCETGSTWTDTQIIVQVSGSMKDGPIRVTTGIDATHTEEYVDDTNDDYGATINDFDVNSVVRPGLCPPSPATGVGHSTVELSGNNFISAGQTGQGTSTVYFENYEASEYYSWDATSLSAQVPLLNARDYSTQVWVGDYVCATAGGVATYEVCSTDADCVGSLGETCETMRCSGSDAFCDEDGDCGSDGDCVSLRQGSNKVSFEVIDSETSSDPIIAAVTSGWMGCNYDATLCAVDDEGISEECDGRNAGETCDSHDDWGPPGQYVTITGTGFGTSTGNVIFTDTTGIAYGDFDFPEACGDDTWEDTEITFKVPANYYMGEGAVSPITTGEKYALTVRTVPGAESEGVEFTILGGTPGPGICNIDPSSGPASTATVPADGVVISGDNLGSTKYDMADVLFSSEVSAEALSWSDASVTTDTVPEGSATGPVYILDSSGYRSNGLNFQVGSCTEGTISCRSGEECCGNGTCSASCPVEPEQSHYSWMFSTGDIPATPRVQIFCESGRGTSPAPWNFRSASEDICVNAAVTASFDMAMDWDDFGSFVVVEKEDGTDVDGEIVNPPSAYQFEWNPTDNGGEFLPSTTYTVTLLAAGIHTSATPTAYMANDYSWTFTTSTSTEPCKIGSVSAMPSEFTAIADDEKVNYSGQALSEDDYCVALDCTAYGWTWTSSEKELASVLPLISTTKTCSTVATALDETASGSPVDITATADNPDGDVDPSDAGQLTINFTDPEVTDWTPSCDTVCLNAGIGFSFNTTMAAEFDGETVHVYACQDSLCADNELTAWSETSGDYSIGPLSADFRTVTIYHSSKPFEANAWYRVLVDGSVSSLSGVALSESGSNYPSEDNGYFEGDFSWKFKTKDSVEVCKVDRVVTDPTTAEATVIGEESLWQAIPFGAPDDCEVDGQQLDPSGYQWDAWTAVDGNVTDASADDVATMLFSSGDPLLLTTRLESGCSVDCTHSGVTLSKYDPVCGDGETTSTSADGTGGEECDGGSSCSTSCLSVGNSDSSTCGDGTFDSSLGEECDDGDSSDSDGCSSICLNAGSTKARTTCGDGTIDQSTNTGGEDCDDGNGSSGDGCSSVCLNEGGEVVSGTYSTCGNSNTEEGEDCDDGDTVDGDGCSSICLYEGADVCAYECSGTGENCTDPGANCDQDDGSSGGECLQVVTPCVGDGVVDYSTGYDWSTMDRSEDCDDGNTDDGDGCSSSGLSEGSSLDYSTPSYCGDNSIDHTGSNDGDATGGEECDAEGGLATSEYHGYWGVSRINASAASDVDATTHTAEATVAATESDSGEIGEGTLTLTCSSLTDADCGNTKLYGSGTSGCCFERPEVEGQYPMDGDADVCRNTVISVDFTDIMDSGSLSSWTDSNEDGIFDYGEGHQNLYLELTYLNGTEDTGTAVDSSNCPSSYVQSYLVFSDSTPRSWIARAWNWVVDSVRQIFGRSASAETTTNFVCITPVTYELTTESMTDSVGSHVALSIADALEAKSTYQLIVVEDADPTNAPDTISGVLSENAVSIDASGDGVAHGGGGEGDAKNIVSTFTTGSEICTLDSVTVEDLGTVESLESNSVADPSIGYFTAEDEVHSVLASAYSIRGGQEEAIQETTAYGWTWSWGTSIATTDDSNTITAATADITETSVTAVGVTGVETIIASADFASGNDTDFETSGGVSGTLQVTSNICDNPPTVGFPYVDDATNFTFYYCRDAGVAGDTTDDLPDFEVGAAPIEVVSYADSGILQELIFKIDGTSDAIGVRVLPNASYLTPSAWYSEQGFTGSPSSDTVDGYAAVTDGNTTYVAATNVSDGIIYPNVYAISYTEGAESTSEDIFSQILDNWSFNANDDVVTDINLCQVEDTSYPADASTGEFTSCESDADCANTCELVSGSATDYACALSGTDCVTDSDCEGSRCDADKAKLTRDMTRLEDVVQMAGTFDAYGDANGFCSVTTNQSCTADSTCPGTETCEPSVPKLADGTFVSSYSVSTWPSWSAALGNALGTSLPTDPLNVLAACENVCESSLCSLTGDACSSDSDCNAFESATCWNSVDAAFVCPDLSHVYGYRSVGGTSFELSAQLEYDSANWAYALDPSDLGTVRAEYHPSGAASPTNFIESSDASAFCRGTIVGISSICGDGVVNTDSASADYEACEIGDTSSDYCEEGATYGCADLSSYYARYKKSCTGLDDTTSCTGTYYTTCLADTAGTYYCSHVTSTACSSLGDTSCGSSSRFACAVLYDLDATGTIQTTCKSDCSGYQSADEAQAAGAECTSYSCGNGVVETDEDCDDGALNGSYGHCGDDCTTSGAFYCGDGYLAGGEECDCGGTTNFSTLSSSSWAVIYGCGTSNGQYQTSPTSSCAYDCSAPGPSCGDGELNGNEICDGDQETSSGTLCDDGTECSSNDDCSDGSTCGSSTGVGSEDGNAACGTSTVCSGASDVGDECTLLNDDLCDSGVCTITTTTTGVCAVTGTSCDDTGDCDDTDTTDTCTLTSTESGACADATDQGIPCTDSDLTDETDEMRDDGSTLFCDVSCGSVVYDLQRTRTCSVDSGTECTWTTTTGSATWTSCVSAEYCGNGTQDGTEECDDGNDDDTDACTSTCEENVCGDGEVYSGVESCDDGGNNGAVCDSSYDSTCHYCTANCQYKTRSGDYCGDGEINGSEYCDGSDVPYYCFDNGLIDDDDDATTAEVNAMDQGGTCLAADEGSATGCDTGTCRQMGICNGGTENGEYCTIDTDDTDDVNDCDDGTCVAPTCSPTCEASCPFTYESVAVLATTEEVGAAASDSIDLYSYDASGEEIDQASLSIPACTVGTKITADVNTSNVVMPSVAIYFITDYTGTMAYDVTGCHNDDVNESGAACTFGTSVIDSVSAAESTAISTLFDSLTTSDLKIGLMRIQSSKADYASPYYGSPGYVIDQAVDEEGSGDENALIAIVEEYAAETMDGITMPDLQGPPMYSGMKQAIYELGLMDADVKLIIMMSDGQPFIDSDLTMCTDSTDMGTCEGEGESSAPDCEDGTSDNSYNYYCCTAQIDRGLLSSCSADAEDGAVRGSGGVLVYTAAVTSSDTKASYMAHISSETCGTDYSTLDDCTTGNYAFSAEDDAGIATMYDAIINSILGVTVGLTNDETITSGTITSGHNKELPFPTNFACTGEEMNIPMTIGFNGGGYVSLDDMTFTYCPVP